jgi:hypothetical protein
LSGVKGFVDHLCHAERLVFFDLVLLPTRRHEYNGHVLHYRQFSQRLKRAQTIHAWHHHVTQYKVGHEVGCFFNRLGAAFTGLDFESAESPECVGGNESNVRLILNQEDALQ